MCSETASDQKRLEMEAMDSYVMLKVYVAMFDLNNNNNDPKMVLSYCYGQVDVTSFVPSSPHQKVSYHS